MAITMLRKKPAVERKELDEKAVDDFLSSSPAPAKKRHEGSSKRKQITLTISETLLAQVDEAAVELGVSRAAYINAAVSTALKNGLTR
jgi:predicted DNA binding CopG/RHH family protein